MRNLLLTLQEKDKCAYKSSMEIRLKQHKKDKHVPETIPCELCAYKGTTEEYTIHINNEHKNKEFKDNEKEQSKGKGKGKTSNTNEEINIPCSLCGYVASSTAYLINHIESEHQAKVQDKTK